MGADATSFGGDPAWPSWIGDVMIAALVAFPVVVGVVWRLVDRVRDRRAAPPE